MIEKYKSIKIEGNNNIVIQGVDKQGAVVVNNIDFDIFLKQYTNELNERIKELKKIIAEKDLNNKLTEKLLTASEELFNAERIKLFEEIDYLQNQVKQKEIQIKNIISELENKNVENTSKTYQNAIHFLVNGDIEKALATLDDRYLENEEFKNAESRLLKASIYELKFDFKNAEINYSRAVNIHPSWKNNLKIANFYATLNRFDKAFFHYDICLNVAVNEQEKANTYICIANLKKANNEFDESEALYTKALKIFEDLAKTNPTTYQKEIAMSLNNLATLQKSIENYDAAEKNFKKAISIYKELLPSNQNYYYPSIAMSLNNLGIIQMLKNEHKSALKSYQESLEIRKIAANINSLFTVNVAESLNNIGNLYVQIKEYDLAEKMFKDSIQIIRTLCENNPESNLQKLASTLSNIAQVYNIKRDFKSAKECCLEAIEIFESLTFKNPKSYTPELAKSFLNVAIVYTSTCEYDVAENYLNRAIHLYRVLNAINSNAFKVFLTRALNNSSDLLFKMGKYKRANEYSQEALSYYEELVESNPQVYLIEFSGSLINAANIKSELTEFAVAESLYLKALNIIESFYKKNPDVYYLDLAKVKINLSSFYQESKIDKEISILHVKEAIELIRLKNDAISQDYLARAYWIINNWGLV